MSRSTGYFVCFIDILGYKELVKQSHAHVSSQLSLIKRLQGIIEETISKPDLVLNMTHKTKFDWFSDSLVISVKQEDDNRIELEDLIKFISYFQAVCLGQEIFVRGGLSFGKHYSKSLKHGRVLISEALIAAVELEKSATYPRILIDRVLINNLLDEHPGPFSGVGIVVDGSDCFVDYERGISYLVGNDIVKWREWLGSLATLIENLIEKHKTDKNIKNKYLWLNDYFYWTFRRTPQLKDVFKSNTPQIFLNRFQEFFIEMNRAKGF